MGVPRRETSSEQTGQMASSSNGAVLEVLPSWLKPSLFLQADFNAEEYVSYLRRFVSPSR